MKWCQDAVWRVTGLYAGALWHSAGAGMEASPRPVSASCACGSGPKVLSYSTSTPGETWLAQAVSINDSFLGLR